MDQKLIMALVLPAVAGAGVYTGYKIGLHKTGKQVDNIITMAQLNSDVLKWVAEECPSMEWDDFVEQFSEKLEYISMVANTLQENFN